MKNSLKVLLMLTAISLSSPSYAQLGDLFRKLGDAVDSVVKNIESSDNETKSESASSVTDDSQKSVSAEQKNAANRQSFDPSKLSVDEIKVYVVGKWGFCNDTKQKNGTYIFLDDKKQINSEFYRDGNLLVSTTFSSVEKINTNNKNLVRITGRIFQYQSEFYKQSKQSRPIQTVWDLGVEDSIRVVQRTIWESPEIWADGGGPRVEEIKDGKLSNGNEVSSTERCKEISENRDVKSITNEDTNKNFGIKGFTLRGSLPTNTKITNSNSKQLGNDNVLNTINFETTILEVPFFGIAVLLNNQIAEVYYFDEITVREFQKREEFTNNIVMTRKLGPLTSYDFSKVANDLVLLINSSLNNPKGQPRTSKINHDKSIAGLCFQHSVMKRLNNNSDKGVEQVAAACNTIQNLINKQCRNCKSTEYGFSWKTDTTDVNVLTVVPESKDMPYAMNFLYIGYKDVELVKKLSQLVNAQRNSDDIQKNRILNESKQREQQMNRERDEKRKKDF
jgi:hypothetical protein